MTAWLADSLRLLWGSLYWNARKSAHLLQGRRRQAPCQVASDSGRAGETGCEAAAAYHSPGRHRMLCPLLIRRSDGAWVCSVGREDVRPFWGRGLLLLLAAVLAAYTTTTLVGFGGLRALGYEISYRQVAWPPAWREFRGVQARFHLERARHALADGRPQDALLSLASAYELNPRDYATGLLLAQLWQNHQALRADTLYARLYQDHPEQREATAQAWYRSLLARGDFQAILQLSGNRLLQPAPATAPHPAWIQAFLFAVRQSGELAAIDQLLAEAALSPELRPLLALERALPELSLAERVASLSAALPAARDPFTQHHLLRRLLADGSADLVLSATLPGGSLLGDRERVRLRLDALAAIGRAEERADLFRQVLALPMNPSILELLGNHLIAHPDPALLATLSDKLANDPLPPNEESLPARHVWLAACAAQPDAERLRAAIDDVVRLAGRSPQALRPVAAAVLEIRGGFRLETLLPLLQPLPLETTYTLYERFAPRPLPR